MSEQQQQKERRTHESGAVNKWRYRGDSVPLNWDCLGLDLARGESVTIVLDYRTNPPTTVHVTEHRQEPNGDHTLKVEDRQVGIRMRYIREWDLVETKKFDIGG